MNPIVNIVIVTYNHEGYIEKAIESALNQICDFDYNIIIGEDCSTDDTLKICKKYANTYPDKIQLLSSETNVGLMKNYLRCFEYCKGTYIAILEGDDYWIDNVKLQKQYDLIKSEDNVGLVHTDYKVLFNERNYIKETPSRLRSVCINRQGSGIFEYILLSNFICAGTVMFQRKYLNKIDFNHFINFSINTIDLILWVEISVSSKILYCNEQTTMYRLLNSSISNNDSLDKLESFLDTKLLIVNYYAKKYDIHKNKVKTFEAKSYVLLFFKSISKFEYIKAIKFFRKTSVYGFKEFFKSYKTNNI